MKKLISTLIIGSVLGGSALALSPKPPHIQTQQEIIDTETTTIKIGVDCFSVSKSRMPGKRDDPTVWAQFYNDVSSGNYPTAVKIACQNDQNA